MTVSPVVLPEPALPICDAAVIALREQDKVTLPQLPRMADFGKFVTAGEQRLGIGNRTFD